MEAVDGLGEDPRIVDRGNRGVFAVHGSSL
jgi:hypothetical protein